MTPKSHPHPPPMRARFAVAMQYIQASNPLAARIILEQIVAGKPRDFEALHFLGVSYAMSGDLDRAAQLVRKAISIRPDYAEGVLNLGNIFQKSEKFEDAIVCFRKAIALQPQLPDPYFSLGVLLENLHRLEEALAIYDKIISLKPDFAPAYTNRGVVQAKLNRLADALASHDAAIARASGFVDAHANRGDVLRALNRPAEALASYNTAISLRPDFAYAYRRGGDVMASLGNYEGALAGYDKAVALEPDFAESYFCRGNVLKKQRRFTEALASYEQAIALQPDVTEAHNARGIVLEKLDRCDEALASYSKAIDLRPDFAEAFYNRGNSFYELNRNEEALADYQKALALKSDLALAKNNIFWYHVRESKDIQLIEQLGIEAAELNLKQELDHPSARKNIYYFRMAHDLEQIDYMLALGHEFAGLRQAQLRLKDIQSRCSDSLSDTVKAIPLSEAEARDVDFFRSSLFRYQLTKPIEHCLKPEKDWRAIEEQYFSSYPEMIFIDDLLSQQALEELRRFCLISVVWKREYINQYLGAFANMGFFSVLHWQIARELQQKMPRVFGDQKLEQVWAYKYNSKLKKGINVHADAAKVNLNFWITPDEANLNPESGGLIVYDVPPPLSWSFDQYNADDNEKGIYDFLEKSQAGSMRVPYKCNRAVLFNSALFHETDEIHFREGYENRRINITYLFGKGLKTD